MGAGASSFLEAGSTSVGVTVGLYPLLIPAAAPPSSHDHEHRLPADLTEHQQTTLGLQVMAAQVQAQAQAQVVPSA